LINAYPPNQQNISRFWYEIWHETVAGDAGFAARPMAEYKSFASVAEAAMSVSSEFDALEKDLLVLKSDVANYNVTHLREKLADVRRVVFDTKGTAEERMAWLRDYLQ